ncbi:MAG: hypothetical protein Q8Q86_01350 [Candidatus Daviesbacteria bacterium]|nr:hypothetical protein [Candidatus Daviesbacteria bacterium]
MSEDPTIIKLMDETNQSPKLRQELIKKIEQQPEFKNTRVILFFTSFMYPVMIDDTDVDIIKVFYRKLLDGADNTKGRIEPFLQQLSNYNPIEVKQLESLQDLSEDIAINALKSGMMSSKPKSEIKRKIRLFLTPETTKVHGRAIYPETAKKAGLNIEMMDHNSGFWNLCWELYIRANHMVSTTLGKLVETNDQHFSISIRP